MTIRVRKQSALKDEEDKDDDDDDGASTFFCTSNLPACRNGYSGNTLCLKAGKTALEHDEIFVKEILTALYK